MGSQPAPARLPTLPRVPSSLPCSLSAPHMAMLSNPAALLPCRPFRGRSRSQPPAARSTRSLPRRRCVTQPRTCLNGKLYHASTPPSPAESDSLGSRRRERLLHLNTFLRTAQAGSPAPSAAHCANPAHHPSCKMQARPAVFAQHEPLQTLETCSPARQHRVTWRRRTQGKTASSTRTFSPFGARLHPPARPHRILTDTA